MFENEEDTPRCKGGKSVAYCETCFNETMIMKRRGSSEGQDESSWPSLGPRLFITLLAIKILLQTSRIRQLVARKQKHCRRTELNSAPLNSTSESNAAFDYSSRLY